MADYTAQIEELLNDIEELKGTKVVECPVDNGQPMNIVGINALITSKTAEIVDLRGKQAVEDASFTGMNFTLKLRAGNMPTLTATGPNAAAIASKINAIGQRPAAIEVDGVTVSVSGSNSIVLSVKGEADVVVVAETLAAFLIVHDANIDIDQAQRDREKNVDLAKRYLDLVDIQTDILEAFDEVSTMPTKPVFGVSEDIMDGKVVTISFDTTGTQPITYDIDWGDGEVTSLATSPAEHEYDDYDTPYEITITATNIAGSATDIFTVTTDEETTPSPELTAPVLSNVSRESDGLTVTVTFEVDGNPTPTVTMDWDDGTAIETVTSPAEHTYDTGGSYQAVLTATNSEGSVDETIVMGSK